MYNRTLALKKDEIMPFAATWMDLESVILSKVSHYMNFWISLSISKLLGIILIDFKLDP